MTAAVQPGMGNVRPRRRIAVASAGSYWSGAAWGTLVVLSFVMVRIGEQLGPLRYVKPVLFSTAAILAIHVAYTSRTAWLAAWAKPQVQLMLVYIACIAASVPFSVWRGKSLGLLQITPWAFAVVLVCALTPPSRVVTDRIALLLPWIAAVYGILVVAAGEVVESTRITSAGSYDPNDLGVLFACMLVLSLGATLRGHVFSRVISAVAAVILLWVLLMTGSRGALLAIGAGMLTFVAAFRPRTQIVLVVVLIAVVPVAWRFAPPVMRQRAATLFALEDDYNATSNSGRVYLWKRGLTFAAKNPIVGVGAGGFEIQLGRDFEEQGTRGAWHTAHNTYVQVFAELGIPGGIALMSLLFVCASAAATTWRWTKPVHRPEYLASVVAYLTGIAFLSHAYSYLLFGMIGLSILFGADVLTMRKRSARAVTQRSTRMPNSLPIAPY